MNNTLKTLLIIALLLTCIGCDQGSKSLVKKHLVQGQTLSYFHDTFRLQFMENTGAFLGMGGALPDHLRFTIFTVLVAGLLSTGLGYLFLGPNNDLRFIAAATLVLGGGISNLADRILNEGRVVDFMNLGVGWLRTGIFNVADMCIRRHRVTALFSLHKQGAQGISLNNSPNITPTRKSYAKMQLGY